MALPTPLDALDPIAFRRVSAQLAPSAVYMRLDDNLRITSYNALAGVSLTIRTRILGLDGYIQASADVHVPATNRTASTLIIPTDEGWLLGVEVFASVATPIIGQTFVIVEIVRGLASSATPLQTVLQGYVTASKRLAFPGSPITDSLEGAGALRSIAGTTPGAGLEISETVPTGARWELLAFLAQFVTSAVVANRVPTITLDDGATVFYRMGRNVSQAASLTTKQNWAQGIGSLIADNESANGAPIPIGIRLGAGYRIKTVTLAIDVADQYSQVQYLVREWLEPLT